jgi:D-alanine-D-alanine ligase
MGGCSSEREVSLRSGKAVADALRAGGIQPVEIDLTKEALPKGIDPKNDVIFPVLHGGYGEGGGFQADLEKAGFAYAGCDAKSSKACMDKVFAKKAVIKAGVKTAKFVVLEAGRKAPNAETIVAETGEDIVVKPADEGSSVGLELFDKKAQLAEWLLKPRKGTWLVEERIHGRELTCGLLDGKGMGIVQIVPNVGVYDYKSKYTAGATKYLFPAPITEAEADSVRKYAEKAFAACACRDYSRADFIMTEGSEPVFLELNTLPGMTATSLLPKSASCIGLDFTQLVRRMIEPAIKRFETR